MTFKNLALYLEKLEKTTSRLEIIGILADLFKKITAVEIDKTVYLVLGQLAPNYQGIVFNLAEKMVLRVLAQAYGVGVDKVREMYKKSGDLGVVAEELGRGRKGNGMEVAEVYAELLKIAQDSGESSQERKVTAMADLLKNLDSLSARYVTRIPLGKLRLGFSDKTILDALSWMEVGDRSRKAKIETAYQVIPDAGLLAREVKKNGIDKACANVSPKVGVPVLPMLAQRIKSPVEMIAKMGRVLVEPKFDGLRVLIHFQKPDFIQAFTRNLNDVAAMFPELEKIGKFLEVKSVILDTEACGMDAERLQLADFQTTMQRRRKHNIAQKAISIPIKFQVFDVLFLDGSNLMPEPYFKRREILKKIVKKNDLLEIDEAVVTKNPTIINKEFRRQITAGLEGVIVKKYDTPYTPGRTGWRWVKMKQEEGASAKLTDTIDALVMGYSAGKGKRASFGLGQFLVGIKKSEKYQTVTKIGTGLSDEQFREMKRRLTKLEVKEKPQEYVVDKNYYPDHWVKPSLVVEIAADEITRSPIHSAGLALRFPRLIKFRDDKKPEQTTTLKELKKLLDLQKN